jgi:hypothetical protein
LILAGWLAAAWQVSLGFTLGLQLLYLLAVIGAVVLVAWLRRGRPAPAPGVVLPTAAGAAGLLVVSWVLARPYLQVLNDHPEAHRTLARVSHLSPPLRSLAAASSDNLIWGGATRSVRTGLPAQNEQLLFPGVAIVLLAAAGLGSRAYPVRARRWLAVGVVVSFVFALGFSIAGEWSPYRLLWELAPGWRGIRTPGRVFTLTSLALALLAAAGAQRLLGRAGGGWRGWIVAVVLMSAVAVEGLGPIPTAAAPVAPPVVAAGRAPLLELPSDAHHDTTYEYWSTRGFPALVNGFSGFLPRQLLTLRLAVYWFPDRGSVALLRRMGVRGVVVHHEFARPDRWRHAATATLRGLGLTRRGTAVQAACATGLSSVVDGSPERARHALTPRMASSAIRAPATAISARSRSGCEPYTAQVAVRSPAATIIRSAARSIPSACGPSTANSAHAPVAAAPAAACRQLMTSAGAAHTVSTRAATAATKNGAIASHSSWSLKIVRTVGWRWAWKSRLVHMPVSPSAETSGWVIVAIPYATIDMAPSATVTPG